MGFISYHGEKEDRYSEVLEYSRARQEEEWKKSEEERISKWLKELTGDDKLAHFNIQELLKLILSQYKALKDSYCSIVDAGEILSGCDTACLWKDFSIDIADRHIQAFHVMPELREKHLQTFIDKIFKLSGIISASEHLEKIGTDSGYRKYFVECFDPTWTGRHFYHLLQYIGKGDESAVEDFLEIYKRYTIILNLYFYQAFRPRDNGWIGQIEAERSAIDDIKAQYSRRAHIVLNPAFLQNPLYKKEEQVVNASAMEETTIVEPIIEEPVASRPEEEAMIVPQSGLDRVQFKALLEKQGIANYVAACKLLLKCEMPENIRENYEKLIERMPLLQDAVDKFDHVYHADLDQFDDYFAPEALTVTATLVEYEVVKPSEEILQDTRENVYQASKKLLLLVNEKIDEIYKFVTIETNAEARALEALMSQDGYVDPELKLRRD